MRGRLVVISTTVALVVSLAGADSAGACACAFGVTPTEQLAAADGAFSGRLLSVRAESASEAVLRYRVGRVFKGRARLHRGQVVTIRDEYSDTDCAMPTRIGVIYGLLVTRRHGRWTSSFCELLTPRKLRRAACAGP